MRRSPKDQKPVPKPRDPNQFVAKREGLESIAETSARALVDGVVQNVATAREFSGALPKADFTTAFNRMTAAAVKVAKGDMRDVLASLAAQQITLNAVFTDCLRRAQVNYQNGEIFDRLMKIGLRAQNQSRATAETISAILHPPVFAKQLQANIANGPQQVNNGRTPRVRAKRRTVPNKLLESGSHVERIERVDTRAEGASVGRDTPVETVDAVNGAAHRRR